MADERLRRIERDAQTGDIDAQARLLLERVRVGDLDREMLRLAAYCGHEASRLALGDQAPEIAEDLEEWIYGLWNRESSIRAAIATATHELKHFEKAFPTDKRPRLAISAAINWVICPCLDHQRIAAHASKEADRASCEARLFYVANFDDPRDAEDDLSNPEYAASNAATWASLTAEVVGSGTYYWAPDGDMEGVQTSLRQVIQSALIPWALGERDPLEDFNEGTRP